MQTLNLPADDADKHPPQPPKAVQHASVPLDVMKAIEREARIDPSDPFLARRLAAHYRQGIWLPADGRAKA